MTSNDDEERQDFTYSIWRIIEDGRWGGQIEKEKATKGACAILSRRDELMKKKGMLEQTTYLKKNIRFEKAKTPAGARWELIGILTCAEKQLEREIKEMEESK